MTSQPTDLSTDEPVGPTPVLAVVGRPNVGKSTLVNRIIGRREAVVQDVPGVTRDRISYDATWNGRAFTVVDTGGWDPDARGLAERIAAQAEVAVSVADAVLFVVDATVGITDADEAVVRILRKAKKPVILAANKVDDQRAEAEAYGLWNLGLGEPYPVSALHGRGSGDMLDAILAALPEPPAESFAEVGGPRRVAIVGKPNVGEAARALVIAINPWDLVDEERRYYLDREIERDLVRVQWAPRVNITARTGWHVDKLVPALDAALEGWSTRVGTGALNSFLGRLVAEHPHPVRGGKQPKVLFGTQASTEPPTFVLFTSGQLEAGYLRFIERRLREEFGFVGTPIHLEQRPRKKGRR